MAFHNVSMSISFTRSIAESTILVYSAIKGVVINGILKMIRDISPEIAMNADPFFQFTCTLHYGTSRSVLPINMSFVGHLSHITSIMCKTHSR